MKRILLFVLVIVSIFALVYIVAARHIAEAAKPANKGADTGKAAKASCADCHTDFASVLPKNHPEVKEKEITACITCHEPDVSGKAVKNPFSAKIHVAHLSSKANLDCIVCHTWVPGKSFGVIGGKDSLGAPTQDNLALMKKVFTSWASSGYMDNLHAKADIVCAGCHGKDLPKADDTVENVRCLECHGPMEQLAQKTEPKDFKDRNPHKSHLGDIACTVCHKGHAESKVYCLECHQKFNMKIKGASQAK
ncbi:MAG TPA: cytochrome c3 family protein [Syntrophales bacterium]|nr:cytochrome c3 family protein [Syntrophales bacterium]